MLKIAVVALVALALVFIGSSYYVSRPVVEGTLGEFRPVIADRADALTFARAGKDLILVTAHEVDGITGINLSKHFGSEVTADFIAFASSLDETALPIGEATLESYPLDALVMPLSYPYPSIAAGTNFKEHAEEVYSDEPPFLFPKLSAAGAWNDEVPFLSRLDFEAELCMFPLADIDSPAALPAFGLVLCNDFTDRLTLIKEIDLGQPLGLTGFASGKGCEQCLPTGYLVVIPRSADFYLSIQLSLYVNDDLRQAFNMREVIMPIEEIIAGAFRNSGTEYRTSDGAVQLLPSGHIPKGSLILTGTAAGVLFKPLNFWHQGFYLQPGDVVRTEATYLGYLSNTVGEE